MRCTVGVTAKHNVIHLVRKQLHIFGFTFMKTFLKRKISRNRRIEGRVGTKMILCLPRRNLRLTLSVLGQVT